MKKINYAWATQASKKNKIDMGTAKLGQKDYTQKISPITRQFSTIRKFSFSLQTSQCSEEYKIIIQDLQAQEYSNPIFYRKELFF